MRLRKLSLSLLIVLLAAAGGQTAPQNSAIIIYRPHRGMGAAFFMQVYVDNELVGLAQSGRYFSVTVPPGPHVVSMPKQKNVVTPAKFDLAAGQEAFVRVRVEGCWGDCNLFLFPMDAASAQADLAKMQPNDPNKVTEHAEVYPYMPGVAPGRKLTLGQPPPAPAPPPAPPKPQPCTLMIFTLPGGADVYLDGVLKGTTSVAEGKLILTDLAAASYSIRISRPEYVEWAGSMTLAAGDTRDVTAKLVLRGPPPFTLGDVEHMLQEGVASKRLATLVKERGVDFALDDAAERRLRSAGADPDLLLAVARAKR